MRKIVVSDPSFKEWIANFQNTDTNLGDLASDILSDNNFPDSSDKDILLKYLESKRAHKTALRTLAAAIDLYHAAD